MSRGSCPKIYFHNSIVWGQWEDSSSHTDPTIYLLYHLLVEENYSESVTIVRRQRFEGGFHIRKNTLKNERGYPSQKCGLTPPGGQIQNGRRQNNCLAFNDPTQQIRYLNICF